MWRRRAPGSWDSQKDLSSGSSKLRRIAVADLSSLARRSGICMTSLILLPPEPTASSKRRRTVSS